MKRACCFLLVLLALAFPVEASVPDTGKFTRVGGWRYIEGDEPSCGKATREMLKGVLKDVRALSYDVPKKTMRIDGGKTFEAERRGEAVIGYVTAEKGELEGVPYFKVMAFTLFEMDSGDPSIMFMRVFQTKDFQCTDAYGASADPS